MGQWNDDETFSAALLHVVRLTETLHFELIDKDTHDSQACAIAVLEGCAQQMQVCARTIARFGAPEDMPDVHKSLVGGQLANVFIGLLNLMERLSPEPDRSLYHMLDSVSERAIELLDGLVLEKQEKQFNRDLEKVLAEARRFLSGNE